MRKMTKLWVLSIACLSLSAFAIGCSKEEEGPSGTGGTGGTGGSAGHAGTGGSGGTAGSGGTGGTAGSGGTGGTAGSGGTGGTGGTAGTGGTGGQEEKLVDISGAAMVNPLAAAVLGPAGVPSLEGLEVRLTDAAKALAGAPDALIASTITDSEGKFSFVDADFTEVTLGVVITVLGDDFAMSTLGLCDPSSTDPSLACGDRVDVKAFAVPMSFINILQARLGDNSLLSGGFVLGQTVGANLSPLPETVIRAPGNTVIYLAPDLTASSQTSTTEVGAFVVKPNGLATLVPEKADFVFTPPHQSVGRTADVVFQAFFVGAEINPAD
ncbi:hypothetical protein [Vulgatibacter incomptus]|uniref:Uncharacterized protein n=1 Tax=Vulgatibacter incomptus TaxID=1391653 RepID=A0A0K1PH32_9BACT|nr:hypothetical protein [Vulgatibacter incomptus]AKU92830.1 hypothetical protein AKJ08_3217 [Vulgatibacter incomptus]